MRQPVIAGNWKMHYTLAEAVKMVDDLIPMVKEAEAEVVLCVPYIHLPKLRELTKGSNVKIGAQNMHFEESGAYTGEISPSMLADLAIDYVIIGHSERRQYFAETDETVNKKLKAAFKHQLIPIMCCGETLEQREQGETESHLKSQIKLGLVDLTKEQVEQMIIAYEPIWAIGTGKTATAVDANDTIAMIRETVKNLYGREVSEAVRIQYGGSVKPDTIKEQMNMSDIDGALVGGASLKAEDFSKIVCYNK